MSLAILKQKASPPPPEHTASTPMPNFSKMQEKARANIEAEITRIVELPRTELLTDQELTMVSRHYLSEAAYARGERLRPEQGLGMVHYNDYGGIFCTLGVGGGKTLLSFMIANDCYNKIIRARQAGDYDKEPRILLVVQANLLQKFENDASFMREFLKEIPPYYIMNGTKRQRTLMATSGRRGLYVCSYHTLSAKDATDTLEAIRPACIICDEAQNVAGTKESARAKRFRNYVSEYQPEVIPLSGTMTRKSVMEYFTLAKAALGKYNFLPNSHKMSEEWAVTLDSNATGMGDFRNDNRPRPGPISKITEWCHAYYPETDLPPNLVGFRRAFAQRMVTAPGVICSTVEDPVGSALIFSNNKVDGKESRPGWEKLQDHLEALTEDFITPSGEQLTCAMNVWGYRYQMEATGFYYDLYWRDVDSLSKARKISKVEAASILERSKESLEKHRIYSAALRWWIKNNSRPHLDTPALIGTNMKNHKDRYVGPTLYTAWTAWKGSMFPEMDCRQHRPVRVCDFKIRACADDVVENAKKGGIIWYHHAQMGLWMMEELRSRGLDPTHCPRGEWSNIYLEESGRLKGKIIVASMLAHSTGKNLQHGFYQNYYLQSPISASGAEQCIGRTHRPGQKKDEVDAMLYLTTEFDHAHFNSLLNDTAYVQQSTMNKQKLLIGTYSFKPRSVPHAALIEMGAVTRKLNGDTAMLLEGILETPMQKFIV